MRIYSPSHGLAPPAALLGPAPSTPPDPSPQQPPRPTCTFPWHCGGVSGAADRSLTPFSVSRPCPPVEAAIQLHPSTLLSHPPHHQTRAQSNPHGRHAHFRGTAVVSAVLLIVAAPRSSTGVGAVVGSVYVGVVWDSRPGMVLCKKHGRTRRFSKRIGTKHAPLANSSSDHFVCRSSSYCTFTALERQKSKSGG